MVVAMGGQEGKYFAQFCKLAIEAYKQLRRNAVLIMSLLRLMKDAGIEAFQVNPHEKLRFVEERFRLDLDDESAEDVSSYLPCSLLPPASLPPSFYAHNRSSLS